MREAAYQKFSVFDPEFPVDVLTNDRYTRAERQSVCYPHWHEQLEVHYITDGELEFVIDKRTHFLRKGDLAVVGANQIHHSYYTGRLQELIFIFKLEELSGELAQRNLCFQTVVRGDRVLEDLMTRLSQEYFGNRLGKEALCKGILLQMLVYLARNFVLTSQEEESGKLGRQLERLSPVRRYIEDHYAEPLDSATLAQLLHLSEGRFNHLFRQVMGMPPRRYINEVRLYEAMKRLMTGKFLASEAAALVGFTDYNYFGRLFRKTFGCTPSQVSTLEGKSAK